MRYLAVFVGLVFMVGGCGGEEAENTPQTVVQQVSAKAESKSADACDLLLAAGPSKILSGTLSEPSRNYTTCTVMVRDLSGGSITVSLDSDPNTIRSKEDFWKVASEGLSYLDIGIDDLREIDGLGAYAIWALDDDGSHLLLWAFWDTSTTMVSIMGVPEDIAFPWAKEAVAMAIEE